MLFCGVLQLLCFIDIPAVPGFFSIVCVPSAVDIAAVAGVPSVFSTDALVCGFLMLLTSLLLLCWNFITICRG
jgi:hypothetical protein